MKNKLFEIPFDVDLLYNYAVCNYIEKPEWMSDSDYTKSNNAYKEAESKVLFKNVKVEYDFCDCSEYGCNHGSYPWGLIFENEPNESYFEDDGVVICNDKGLVRFNSLKDISIGHFVNACELLEIKLEYAENGKKILND